LIPYKESHYDTGNYGDAECTVLYVCVHIRQSHDHTPYTPYEQSVENVQIQKAALLSEQKDISIQLTIAERNKTSIERKMAKREKKLRELKKELKTYIDEQDRRKTKRDEMKKQLIR
jgi:hypothetical protein